jgi:hypothetical protein
MQEALEKLLLATGIAASSLWLYSGYMGRIYKLPAYTCSHCSLGTPQLWKGSPGHMRYVRMARLDIGEFRDIAFSIGRRLKDDFSGKEMEYVGGCGDCGGLSTRCPHCKTPIKVMREPDFWETKRCAHCGNTFGHMWY